jgi:hypothetical protein
MLYLLASPPGPIRCRFPRTYHANSLLHRSAIWSKGLYVGTYSDVSMDVDRARRVRGRNVVTKGSEQGVRALRVRRYMRSPSTHLTARWLAMQFHDHLLT